MDNRHLLNNHNELIPNGRTSMPVAPHKEASLESIFVTDSLTTPTLLSTPVNVKITAEGLKMEPGLEAQLAGLQTSTCGPVAMASLPISALNSSEKLNVQVSDLENIPILNPIDGRTVDLQSLAANNQSIPGVQMVKLTLINCGDQQTILLTTPSGPLSGWDQSADGLTITIPENLLGGNDLNLAGLSTVPVASIPQSQPPVLEPEPSGISDKVNYATITSLPPITSVSDKLYAQKVPTSAPSMVDATQNYAFQDLVPLLTSNGDKTKLLDKTAPSSSVFQTNTADFFQTPTVPITLNLPAESSVSLVDYATTELKIARPISPDDPSPPSNNADNLSDADRETMSPGIDCTEINTRELALQISSELKRYSIPQAVFAQKILHRSQGTLSDLLRNPKPWSKLKSGRETFKRMWKWLHEPQPQRMAELKAATTETEVYPPKRKSSEVKPGEEKSAKRPRLVFTDIQRRTLHAIFKETKRPSKEMQVTIAQQLDLEVSTVANFFMNARRRSVDKWQDDNEVRQNDSPSPSHSVDATSPTQPSQATSNSQPPNLHAVSVSSASSNDPLLASQVLPSDSLQDNPLLSSGAATGVDFSDSPAPPSLTPDTVVTSSLTLAGGDLPTQVPVSGGILVTTSAPSDTNSTTAVPQLLTHSMQLLPVAQSAILINTPLDTGACGGGRDDQSTATANAATACLISGLPVSLDSLSLPSALFPTPSSASGPTLFRTEPAADSPNPGLVLPSASTLIGHDRGVQSSGTGATTVTTTTAVPLRQIKQESPMAAGPPTHVAIPINPKK
ncbi:Homeodomain protein CUT [Echinococcus multilocularis]|uniref:One cut domain family member n=1 Tax=Echinococcus multilocularis TaxID=6211 RepID=A0A068YI03_ECHMU|nr:Homeodomain protein CUT [Echinococcus multilocularis]